MQVYEWTGPTGVKFRDIMQPSGVYYRDSTPQEVIKGLENAIKNRSRVRFFYGDNDTGEDWGEENDVLTYSPRMNSGALFSQKR